MSIHALSYTFTCISDTCRSSTYTNTYVFLVRHVHVYRISIHTSYTCGYYTNKLSISCRSFTSTSNTHIHRHIQVYISTYHHICTHIVCIHVDHIHL